MKTLGIHIWVKLVFAVALFTTVISINAQTRVELGAMIDHQRQIHTVSLFRIGTTELRKEAHEKLKDNMKDLEKIDKAFDKVDKAIGIVDGLVTGGVTFLKMKHTISDIKTVYEKTKTLVGVYKDQCLLRKDVKEGDTIFISSCMKMIESIYKGANEIKDLVGLELPPSKGSLVALVAASKIGKLACSSADMIFILEDICDSCDKISIDIRHQYFRLWEYMMLRIGYWKDIPAPRRPTRELCDNAIDRWLQSAGISKSTNNNN